MADRGAAGRALVPLVREVIGDEPAVVLGLRAPYSRASPVEESYVVDRDAVENAVAQVPDCSLHSRGVYAPGLVGARNADGVEGGLVDGG